MCLLEQVSVLQDGRDFYLYADAQTEEFIRVISAPFKVFDFDMEAASRARRWFDDGDHDALVFVFV